MASCKDLYINVDVPDCGLEEPRSHEQRSHSGSKGNSEEDGLYEAVDPLTKLEWKPTELVPTSQPSAWRPTCSHRVVIGTCVALLTLSVSLNVLLLAVGTVHYSKMTTTLEQVEKENRQLQDTAVCTSLGRDWTFFQGKYYFFSYAPGSWELANQSCAAMDSHLVMINSAEEEGHVTRIVKSSTSWIGLTDQVHEGNWKWVDGTGVDSKTSYWQTSEPNGGKSENCALMKNSLWQDSSCKESHRWICERML
nr:CD209 antigen-like protein C [Pogona vitticeps]